MPSDPPGARSPRLKKGAELLASSDYSGALSEFMAAAADGDAVAQFAAAAVISDFPELGHTAEESFELMSDSAEQGYAEAQYHLGNYYSLGYGTAKDLSKAYVWYSRAAEQGHARAQNQMGIMLLDGSGPKRDDALAAEMIAKSAE